ncbi:MAG: helix-turn-helix domain-containing protein [Alphaproteobacteria bacterium]|nr:helix-turn-helix domain-containing protein [Alphaproteobacteria bacterium]MBU2191625.1 helix-turn-helix domain-containing protein [Alphaproteobacteria bacterium]
MSNAGKDTSLPEPVAAAVAAGTNIVRALRESRGYAVEELALTCGLATTEIATIEAGDDADPGRLRRIAHALGVPEQNLLGG